MTNPVVCPDAGCEGCEHAVPHTLDTPDSSCYGGGDHSMLNVTKIEYGNFNWNWLRGCANGTEICAIRDKCWARGIAGRFHRDFTPTFDAKAFNASFPRKPGARILVCFTGDISYADTAVNRLPFAIIHAYARMLNAPEHTFLLLTKRPDIAYKDIKKWPSNVWVGISITGAESPERQQAMKDSLLKVQGAGVRWISFEPVLGPLRVSLEGIDWLVVGANSSRGAKPPEEAWIRDATRRAIVYPGNIPLWQKANLIRKGDVPADLIQELPKGGPHAK